MKKYIFFIREYNDWDNIGPIIYYLGKNSSSKICVCFYNVNLRNTVLFEYLNKEIGNNLEFFFWTPKKTQIIKNYLLNLFYKVLSKLNFKCAKSNLSISEHEIKNWFEKAKIKSYKNIIVIFDRTLGPILKKVSKNLQGLNHTFISCAHGPQTNVNRMCFTNEVEIVSKKKKLSKYLEIFKYLIVSDYLELEFNDKFGNYEENVSKIDTSRLLVLGSIRYCPEWLTHVNKFTPIHKKNNSTKKKVVLFMKKYSHNVFKEEVQRTIEVFKSFSDIDFYLKPHTRGMKFSSKIKSDNIHITNNETSSELINIADAVLFYGGTSIILEALAKEKIVACIDYLDCNRNIFEYFNSCHNLRCRDDLCFFLNSIKFNKTRPISGKKLLQEIVYARDESSSVPTRYINFFQNL